MTVEEAAKLFHIEPPSDAKLAAYLVKVVENGIAEKSGQEVRDNWRANARRGASSSTRTACTRTSLTVCRSHPPSPRGQKPLLSACSARERKPRRRAIKTEPIHVGPIRLEFWTYVASYLEDAGSSAWLRPDERSWVTAGSGAARGETYAQARTNLGTFGVQYLSNAYTTRSLFNWLLSNREAIQAAFPERLTWVDTPASYQQYLEVSCGSDIEDRDAWPGLAAWYGERLETLREVLGPLVGRWVKPDPERGSSPELFRACLSENNPEVTAPAERLIEWAERHLPEVEWPTDRNIPAWTPYLKKKGVWYSLPRLIADGSLQLQLPTLKRRPGFYDAAVRAELMRKLNELPCVDLPPEAAHAHVKLPLAMFAQPDVLDELLRVLDWFVDRVHSAPAT